MRLSIASAVATFSAALLLYPLFRGGAWFWGSLGAVLVVLLASMISGRLSLPAWAAGLVSVVGVWVYLTASFAAGKAWLLVIPTKGSVVALAKLFVAGWTDIQRFAAPVPANPGITLLTAGGVGLIAIVVDLLATRLRRAALAGLPMLALVTVPATILSDPLPWGAFILAALGFTSLLIADGRDRITHWGRAVLVRRTRAATTPLPRESADTRGLRLSGKRIGFAAIALAVLLGAMMPVMEPVSFFTFGVGGGKGKGNGNSISIPNPIANLKGKLEQPDHRVVLTYTNNDDVPRYLRIYTLDRFDGEQFTMTEPKGAPENKTDNGPLPAPPGLSSTTKTKNVQTKIRMSDEIERLAFLPLPYPPREIRADGDWRADVGTLMVFSTSDEAAGLNYDVSTAEPDVTSTLLETLPLPDPGSVDQRYLRLPDDFPPDIRDLALQVTKGAANSYEAAVKLQEFFTKTGKFTYSLRTQGHSNSALRDFLLHSRAGYCEQFAASMALLARAVGIPARVAIGFTGGTKIGGEWTVGTNDSHSWPELYFEGVGWLPFEPTPTGSLGQGSARVPAYTQPLPRSTSRSTTPTPGATSQGEDTPLDPQNRRNLRELDREAGFNAVGLPKDDSMPVIGKVGIGAGILLLLLLVPAAMRAVTRNRRVRTLAWKVSQPSDAVTARVVDHQPSVAAAWAELDDALFDYGLARQPNETPRMLARRLTEQYEFDAESAGAIAAIASAVERVLFARDPGTIDPLRKDLRKVRRALAATVSRGRRVRAVLFPPSTLRRIRRMGEGILDGFDRLENIRLRRRSA